VEPEVLHEWQAAHEVTLAKVLLPKFCGDSKGTCDRVRLLRCFTYFCFEAGKYLQEEAHEDL
jgi:hypothetical protein